MEIDITKNLFLCLVSFDDDECDKNRKMYPLKEEDYNLHFTANALKLLNEGAKFVLFDSIPERYHPAQTACEGLLHFATIESPDRKSYLPLFVSFETMMKIYGNRIRVGVVTYDDLKDMCLKEDYISGIVLGPGNINRIICKEDIK